MTVRIKILLQEIWKAKVTWDKPLPDTIKDRWTAILTNLKELSNLFIPRLYLKGGTHIDDLFVFADASTKSYGDIVYFSSVGHVSLAMSKTRVGPTRTITLPRLERTCYCHQTY